MRNNCTQKSTNFIMNIARKTAICCNKPIPDLNDDDILL